MGKRITGTIILFIMFVFSVMIYSCSSGPSHNTLRYRRSHRGRNSRQIRRRMDHEEDIRRERDVDINRN